MESAIPIASWRDLFGARRFGVYDLLSHLPPGLMLDVGAAAGVMTRQMLKNSPQSTVIAFEPFPGNHPHFEKAIGSDPRVTLLKAAVASESTPRKFFLGRAVSGSEKGWEALAGYSSGGFLVTDKDERAERSITVDTVGIDETIGERRVRFMKIDVQGGELDVLRSAKRAIAEKRIDLMVVEFTGDRNLLTHLFDCRMRLFDLEYTLIPRKPRKRFSWKALLRGTRRADLSNWDVVGGGTLSNGVQALRAWPRVGPRTPDEFRLFFDEERRRVGRFWTDLVAVAPHFAEDFMAAVSKAAARN
jgi:FkbM family methyltransferase